MAIVESLGSNTDGIVVTAEAEEVLAAIELGETDGISCWRANSVELRAGSEIDGRGLFARIVIPAASLLAIKQGRILNEVEVRNWQPMIQGSHQQIDTNKFLAGLTQEQVDRNLVGYNHSCEPNAKLIVIPNLDLAFLVARRTIEASEEVTVDYAVSHLSATHQFECNCGSQNCRGYVDCLADWTDPVLQQKYAGEFPQWLHSEINSLQNFVDRSSPL